MKLPELEKQNSVNNINKEKMEELYKIHGKEKVDKIYGAIKNIADKLNSKNTDV